MRISRRENYSLIHVKSTCNSSKPIFDQLEKSFLQMEPNYFLRLNKILFVTFVILVRGQTESEIGKSKNPSILRNDHNQ